MRRSFKTPRWVTVIFLGFYLALATLMAIVNAPFVLVRTGIGLAAVAMAGLYFFDLLADIKNTREK